MTARSAQSAHAYHQVVGGVRAGSAVGRNAWPLLAHLHLPVLVE
jgi:hypothetical protein